MLIHRRKAGEALLIGDSVEIRIISVGKKVVLGILAPREVSVTACKISDTAMENTLAASYSANIDRIIKGTLRKSAPGVLLFKDTPPEEQPQVADNTVGATDGKLSPMSVSVRQSLSTFLPG